MKGDAGLSGTNEKAFLPVCLYYYISPLEKFDKLLFRKSAEITFGYLEV